MNEEWKKKIRWSGEHQYTHIIETRTCSLDPAPDVSSAAGAAGSVGLADIVSLLFFQNTGYF
jgi:hypothetical protein